MQPWDFGQALMLTDRGTLRGRNATETSSMLPRSTGKRELERVQSKLSWGGCQLENKLVESAGPRNVVSLCAEYEQKTTVFDSVGEQAFSAERVVGRAIKAFKDFDASAAAMDEHLVDHLLLPMALGAGGQFTTAALSRHTLTNIQVLEQFLGPCISVEASGSELQYITVNKFVR